MSVYDIYEQKRPGFRDRVRRVGCPTCKARAMRPCVATTGRRKESNHLARIRRYLMLANDVDIS